MNPQPLHRPFIGITLNNDDYAKVQGLLPIPSYTDTLQAYSYQKIILIYAIEGYITSPSQYRWVSNIKLGLQQYLCVPFGYEEDFAITDHTEATSLLYDIKALSLAFKAPIIYYPKIMYPPTKKELYRHLCRYGIRLIHQGYFTKEAMTATALLMNKSLQSPLSQKELHQKIKGAVQWIEENKEGFKTKLSKEQLSKARSKGAMTKNLNQAKATQKRVQHFLATGEYTKPNGKVNISKLAKAMNMTRKTIAKYI